MNTMPGLNTCSNGSAPPPPTTDVKGNLSDPSLGVSGKEKGGRGKIPNAPAAVNGFGPPQKHPPGLTPRDDGRGGQFQKKTGGVGAGGAVRAGVQARHGVH